jgi:catechol 2,3-dioxygenase-like lactoylglutathione lyase family enzyme
VSLQLYCDILGFTIEYQRPEEGFASITREGARLMLEVIQYESERTWLAAQPERPFGRGINLQITVGQVEALYASVKTAGVPVFWPLEDRWYRVNDGYVGSRQFVIQDPDGYLLRFAQAIGSRPELT